MTTPAVPTGASAEERQALREAVAGFLADRSTESDVRRVMSTPEGHDPKVWSQLAELGLQGLAIPEEHGGAGSTFEEVGVVLAELGRAIYPGPFLATAIATQVLLAANDGDVSARHLPAIAAGERIATVAVEQPANGSVPAPQVTAADGHLNGVVPFVLDGQLADLVLVAARGDEGVGVYTVEPGAAGITADALETTDQTRRLARLTLSGTPAVRLGGPELMDHALAVGAAALACGQVGGAEAAMASAVSYARVRTQFGRPIGSFQAIKHICAEMFLGVESGKAAAGRAALEVADDGPELGVLTSIAKAWCSDTYAAAAAASLQVHGGIGFTWEHSAHLHLRRAKTDELLFGDARHHRARLADILGV
jgi:alkylation response protein AidB-like acyl-CoA dehydrogenase